MYLLYSIYKNFGVNALGAKVLFHFVNRLEIGFVERILVCRKGRKVNAITCFLFKI